ncbi:MAG: gamma carbonic anhydrase family protein [Lentisphaerae bacterium]|nr:MAG: gamma carbonic anhydrase family protein [Lentisphaerota bacterium]
MILAPYISSKPELIDPSTIFVAEGAVIRGYVILHPYVNIWFNAVIRGDCDRIEIGPGTNIQDGAVLHTDPEFPLSIGSNVTVGHQATLHGCQVGDECIIGMGACILNGAKIGKNSIIGAHALIPEGREIPPKSLVVGVPGKVVRQLGESDIERIRQNAAHYVEYAQLYKQRTQSSEDTVTASRNIPDNA